MGRCACPRYPAASTLRPASFVPALGRSPPSSATRPRPVDVFELEPTPRVARMLLLASCDAQQATIERSVNEPTKALLRLQLPTRPSPQTYRDWTWVECSITLPPTVPTNAVIHPSTLRIACGKVRADLACTHAVPKIHRAGHTVALGVGWGLNTLLSAGAVQLHDEGQADHRSRGGHAVPGRWCAAQALPAAPNLGAFARQGRPLRPARRPSLDSRVATLAEEIRRVWARRSNLNRLTRYSSLWDLKCRGRRSGPRAR